MVDLSERLKRMKEMVEQGKYFTINRGRQYGKTTTLYMLQRYLESEYIVISLDFQAIGSADFASEIDFSRAFAILFSEAYFSQDLSENSGCSRLVQRIFEIAEAEEKTITLFKLFRWIREICSLSEKPMVLFIDEVDSAANNQVFLGFLAQLRLHYLERKKNKAYKTFQSVILAGVTDVKNLKRRVRPDEKHKVNSPWNIAEEFTIDMSFSTEEIAGMLSEYEEEHHTGMDITRLAAEIRDYTGGYPFLVCRICQILDSELAGKARFPELSDTWTIEGVNEAVREILFETNTLFDSLMGKLYSNEELCKTLKNILFGGEAISYDPDKPAVSDARMYGFIRVENERIVIANRIFETRLYNYFLGEREIISGWM